MTSTNLGRAHGERARTSVVIDASVQFEARRANHLRAVELREADRREAERIAKRRLTDDELARQDRNVTGALLVFAVAVAVAIGGRALWVWMGGAS
jgi:hypothetical protein